MGLPNSVGYGYLISLLSGRTSARSPEPDDRRSERSRGASPEKRHLPNQSTSDKFPPEETQPPLGIVTASPAACRHFEDVNYVLLGLDRKNNLLGIKPVQKQEIDTQIYPEDQLHRISIGKSYGRISNKTFIRELSQIYRLDLSDNKYYKYDARFDVIHQILLVDL